MNLQLNSDIFSKVGLSEQEALRLLCIKFGGDTEDTLTSLVTGGYITQFGGKPGWSLSKKAEEALIDIVDESGNKVLKSELTDEELSFANKLRELYPAGINKRAGQSWRGTTREIAKKIRRFRELYGNTYSDEDILNATEAYVNLHRDDPYMRLLKYFILKFDKKIDEEGKLSVVEISDLADVLQNDVNIEDTESWQSTIV